MLTPAFLITNESQSQTKGFKFRSYKSYATTATILQAIRNNKMATMKGYNERCYFYVDVCNKPIKSRTECVVYNFLRSS